MGGRREGRCIARMLGGCPSEAAEGSRPCFLLSSPSLSLSCSFRSRSWRVAFEGDVTRLFRTFCGSPAGLSICST